MDRCGFSSQFSINRLTDVRCTDATVFVYKAILVVVVAGVFF